MARVLSHGSQVYNFQWIPAKGKIKNFGRKSLRDVLDWLGPEYIEPDDTKTAALPSLVWEGPDEDGDLIVRLVGMPDWHLIGHGKTCSEALACIGEAMAAAGEPHR